MTIDTLSIARDLRAAELPTEQAEAIAAAIGRSVAEASATKSDLALTKAELQSDAARTKAELQADIEQVRTSLEVKLEQVRTEIERSRHQVVLWVIGSQVTIAGILLALIKL